MKEPLVSICCTTYNHGSFIRDCIEGLLMQETSFKYEILIYDDASTDDTAAIIKSYEILNPDIIKPIYQDDNQFSKGVKPSLEYNFPRAKGKYIAMCEGDDYWTDPLKLQKQVTLLEDNTDIGIIHTKYIIKNEIQNSSIVHEREIHNKNFNDFNNYLYTGDMRTLTVMFRSSYLKDIFELFELHETKKAPAGDRLIFLLIASKSQIGYINEVCGIYRIFEGESASRFNEKRKFYDFLIKVGKVNLFLNDYLGINNHEYKNYVSNRIRYHYIHKSLIERDYISLIKNLTLKLINLSHYDILIVYTKAIKTIKQIKNVRIG